MTLQSHGYRVYEESSGARALHSWSDRLDQIELLLTDIVMPGGVSGWELGSSLQAEKPQLKTIYMSGYNTDDNHRDKNVRFLAKPFNPEKLAETVRACLDEGKQMLNGAAKLLPVLQS